MDHNETKFRTLNPLDVEKERELWLTAAQAIGARENLGTGLTKIKIKAPSAEALKRRQTKNKIGRETIHREADLIAQQTVVSALSSDDVLNLVREMEKNFQSNIILIDQISAENAELEIRLRELEGTVGKIG